MSFTNFKSDRKTRLDDKAADKRQAAAHWQDLCRTVDTRDRLQCRACKRKLIKTLTARPDRLERHHVIPLSLGGENAKRNIALLCLQCHTARHVTRTLNISGNADKLLRFEQGGKVWRG